MRRLIALSLGLSLAVAPVFAGPSEQERAHDAVVVLDEIMRIPEDAIPQSMLDHAQAIAVIPNVIKAGLVIGGRHGRGLIAVRSADGTWSNPSYISLTGASIGFQAVLQSTDVVLISWPIEMEASEVVPQRFSFRSRPGDSAGSGRPVRDPNPKRCT